MPELPEVHFTNIFLNIAAWEDDKLYKMFISNIIVAAIIFLLLPNCFKNTKGPSFSRKTISTEAEQALPLYSLQISVASFWFCLSKACGISCRTESTQRD